MKRDLFHIQKAIRKLDVKEVFYYFAALFIGFSAIQLSKAETPPMQITVPLFELTNHNQDDLLQLSEVDSIDINRDK